uniref:Uncharacterized protein n=1 Tax=Lepeophtheirus salmonis TaxID=72036 RepID=A0A0K2TNQ8_LEPSM
MRTLAVPHWVFLSYCGTPYFLYVEV